jgi:hypothetical protein
MRDIVRFWLFTGGLLVGFAALGYLAMTFLFPELALVESSSTARLVAILVGGLSLGFVVWTTVAFEGDVM